MLTMFNNFVAISTSSALLLNSSIASDWYEFSQSSSYVAMNILFGQKILIMAIRLNG
jgi:hypothetical protein